MTIHQNKTLVIKNASHQVTIDIAKELDMSHADIKEVNTVLALIPGKRYYLTSLVKDAKTNMNLLALAAKTIRSQVFLNEKMRAADLHVKLSDKKCEHVVQIDEGVQGAEKQFIEAQEVYDNLRNLVAAMDVKKDDIIEIGRNLRQELFLRSDMQK